MQYSASARNEPGNTNILYLGRVRGKRVTYNCTGVKYCERIAPEIRDITYYQPDQNLFDRIAVIRGRIDEELSDPRRQKTLR